MDKNYRRYPIGIQNFEQLRNRDCVYVDKTELIYKSNLFLQSSPAFR